MINENEYVVVKDNEGNYSIVFGGELPNAMDAVNIVKDIKQRYPELSEVQFNFELSSLVNMANKEIVVERTKRELGKNEFIFVKGENDNYYLVVDDKDININEIENQIRLLHPELGYDINYEKVNSRDINLDKCNVIYKGFTAGNRYEPTPMPTPTPYPTPTELTSMPTPMPTASPEMSGLIMPRTSDEKDEAIINLPGDFFKFPLREHTIEPYETKFMHVDIKEYVSEGLNSGKLTPIYAKKTAPTHLVQGEQGEKVVSWVENEDGSPRIEREGTVQIDDETGELGWVATKVDMNGEPVIDRNGHMNQWIIKDSVVKRTYEPSKAGENLYQKKEVQTLVQIPDNIEFENKYGEVMNVAAGGYINITNYERMYGISERDFNDTHVLINEIGDDEKSAYEQAKQQFEELRLKLLKDAEQNSVDGFGRTR